MSSPPYQSSPGGREDWEGGQWGWEGGGAGRGEAGVGGGGGVQPGEGWGAGGGGEQGLQGALGQGLHQGGAAGGEGGGSIYLVVLNSNKTLAVKPLQQLWKNSRERAKMSLGLLIDIKILSTFIWLMFRNFPQKRYLLIELNAA